MIPSEFFYFSHEGPVEYVKAYDPFIYLIDGRAEVEIEQYIKEAHTFDEFSLKVKFFDDLGRYMLTVVFI